MSQNQVQILAHNLNFFYGKKQILKSVSFAIQQGDYIGLVGPNGGGKTTLLKILLGLIPSFTDCTCLQLNIPLNQIGYVPQRATQNLNNFPATVLEIIKTATSNKKLVQQTLKKLKIEHLASSLISQLSGGELQRVMIARSLVLKPKILILDEPIVGVDVPSQKDFYQILANINKQDKITILFVSHDLDVITKHANKIFCLNQTLDTHLDSSKFSEQGYIEKTFGADQHLIHHHHH